MTPRRTKIVCTLGPATDSAAGIRALVDAGMDVARLNFSHGDPEHHRRTIRTVRRVAEEAGRQVGVLQDLAGPKIRLGRLPGDGVLLEAGRKVTLVSGMEADDDRLPVDYEHLAGDVEPGDHILLADGAVDLEVDDVSGREVRCTVVVGDRVTSRKGVNLPGTSLRVPSFTEADRAHLALGLEEEVDLVALSFVRHETDLDPVLEMLGGAGSRPLLLAKIEKPEAVDRLMPILQRVDGVMVARGDLGVEMPVEQVPLIQKRVIREARRAGRPVITATQMLRSMVSSPRPLRAEATDVANAILDGTDAVMLSEETAVGAYPDRAVEVLDRLARAVEPEYDTRHLLDEPPSSLVAGIPAAVSRAACSLAAEVHAAAVVAATTSGSTARMVARFRPPRPVVAVTTVASVARQLTLSWGVLPTRVEVADDPDSVLESSVAAATGLGVAGPGDLLVTTAGLPLNVTGTTNVLRVVEVEGSET